MEFRITGKHLDVTDAIRDFAQKKTERLQRYFDRIRDIEVLIDKHEHREVEVEMIVHVEGANPFIVTVDSPDLYAAIDECVDKLERQLTDHKEKIRNRKHLVS